MISRFRRSCVVKGWDSWHARLANLLRRPLRRAVVLLTGNAGLFDMRADVALVIVDTNLQGDFSPYSIDQTFPLLVGALLGLYRKAQCFEDVAVSR